MNKQLIQSRFSRSYATYEQQADVQKHIAGVLARKAGEYLPASCDSLLEIGCGTGFLTREILQVLSPKLICLNDLSAELPAKLPPTSTEVNYLAGDAEQLTFPESVDGVLSASALQWMTDLPSFYDKVCRTLQPGGIFVFNTFGPENLHEIKTLLGVGLHYPDLEEQKAMLSNCFELKEVYTERLIRYFDSPQEVLRHLQATGVTATPGTFRWTQKRLQTFDAAYREKFSHNGQVTLSWEVLYFVCKAVSC